MRTAPCKGCGKRSIGCHAECEAYLQWKKDREEILQAKIRERNAEYISETKIKRWRRNVRNSTNRG